jgi:hypothetical protein
MEALKHNQFMDRCDLFVMHALLKYDPVDTSRNELAAMVAEIDNPGASVCRSC